MAILRVLQTSSVRLIVSRGAHAYAGSLFAPFADGGLAGARQSLIPTLLLPQSSPSEVDVNPLLLPPGPMGGLISAEIFVRWSGNLLILENNSSLAMQVRGLSMHLRTW
jgi:hypothetical protein